MRAPYPARMPGSLFAHIIGHDRITSVLEQQVARPATGYVFVGPQGVGKRCVAEAFLRGILSIQGDASYASHPDVIELFCPEDKASIGIEQARAFREQLSMRPVRGAFQVAYIPHAALLTREASESLLKCVEEPTPGTVFIFVVESVDRLPATLRSRLVEISFGHVPTADIMTWLVSRGVDAAAAPELARHAHGAPGLAFRLSRDPDVFFADERDAREVIESCLQHQAGRRIAALDRVEKRVNGDAYPMDAWAEWFAVLERLVAIEMVAHPREMSALGRGIGLARASIGGSISPKYGIEWSMIDPTGILNPDLIPSFLYPSYV